MEKFRPISVFSRENVTAGLNVGVDYIFPEKNSGYNICLGVDQSIKVRLIRLKYVKSNNLIKNKEHFVKQRRSLKNQRKNLS